MEGGERQKPTTWKSKSFCNLILEVTFHHFCVILFVRSGPLGAADALGEAVTQEHE